jgi:hypothetical protein
VSSDHTNASVVSLLTTAGEVRSESFISSSSKSPGLSTALSGDVSTPSSIVPGDELVLIDRHLTSVLTWVNLETAVVRDQLSVTTGFISNPQDYVPFAPTKAFVTRLEPNFAAGSEPFDGGNDVLVIDPSVPEITGRIDLMPAMEGAPAGLYPRASGALMARGALRVLCLGMSADFRTHTDSRLVTIDPETLQLSHVLVIPGFRSCGSAEPSPDGTRLAVTCNGSFQSDPADGFPDSGVVLVDLGDVPAVSRQLSSRELGIGQMRSATWTSDGALLLVTTGREETSLPGAVLTLDLTAGTVSPPLLETTKNPFDFGPALCELPSRRCFVPDAGTDGGVLHELTVDPAGHATAARRLRVETSLGLPPRSIGRF